MNYNQNVLSKIAAESQLLQKSSNKQLMDQMYSGQINMSDNDEIDLISETIPENPVIEHPPPKIVEPLAPVTSQVVPPVAAQKVVIKKKDPIYKTLLLTVFIFILFILLVHPKTSTILDKYIPAISTTKGILIRAGILSVAYLVISLILRYM